MTPTEAKAERAAYVESLRVAYAELGDGGLADALLSQHGVVVDGSDRAESVRRSYVPCWKQIVKLGLMQTIGGRKPRA